MTRHGSMLTDRQWDIIKKYIPARKPSRLGGRPAVEDRACFEGILWVLRSGARWRDLPDCYPSPSTCWRRMVDWENADVFLKMWHAFLDQLDEAGRLDWNEVFADGSFAPAKKGAPRLEKPNAERVRSGWWWQMAREFLCHVPSTAPRRRK
jgi:transposase